MEGQLWEAPLDLVLNLTPSVGEGGTPPATGLLFIDGSSFINFKCFFFYLPHCQDLINIHEFPALEYLSSWEEEGAGRERARRGSLVAPGGWVSGENGGPFGFFSRLEAVLPSHSWQD